MRVNARYIDLATSTIAEREFEARSREEARLQIERQGQVLVELRVAKATRPSWLQPGFDLRSFCLEFRALLLAGLGIVGSLEALNEAERTDAGRRALEAVTARVREGKALATAFEAAPDAFPALFRAAVHAGEASGELQESIGRFAAYLEDTRRVRQQAVSAAIYPLLVCAFGAAVVAFLLIYVVPRFAAAFDATASGVGWPTRALLGLGAILHDHLQLVLVALIAGIWALVRLLADAERRRRALAWTLSTRPIAALARTYFAGQFYRTMAMMLAGGNTVTNAVALGRSVVAAMPGAGRLQHAEALIQSGKGIAEALSAAGMTDHISYRLVAAGERSGRLAEMMGFAADHYERRMTLILERTGRFVEPVLLMFVALMIGTVVVLMYMPIFDLASNLQ